MMLSLKLLVLSAFHGCVVLAAAAHDQIQRYTAEVVEDSLQSRLQTKFDEIFRPAQTEAHAMWIGISHPDIGDMYFVFGNSTSSVPGMSPPDIPATLNNTFQIGSISKTFLGTAMLLLEERGDLSLSDKVGTLIPEFTTKFPQYANYTIENLLRMETVVGDFFNDQNGILNNYTKDITQRYSPEEIVTYAIRDGYYPLEQPDYSSTNFVVADVIVEKITGQVIQDVIDELVFKPLGLSHTNLPDRYSIGELPSPAASSYLGSLCYGEFVMFGAEGLVIGQDNTNLSQGIVMAGTAGAMNTNIFDLLAWAKSGTGDSLLTQEAVTRRHQVGKGYSGYGIAQYDYKDTHSYSSGPPGWRGHAGDALGYEALAFHNKELGVSFAGAVNSCGGAAVITLEPALFDIVAEEFKGYTNPTPIPTVVSSSDTLVTSSVVGVLCLIGAIFCL
jgi:CubicO group peptidase (beta-lactamase class C family)